jgi:hypothetical protein
VRLIGISITTSLVVLRSWLYMSNCEEFEKEIALQAKLYAEGRFDSYFKYCNDDSKVIENIFGNQVIRFTQPRSLNDPLEFSPIMRFNDPQSRYKSYELNGISLPSVELFFRVQIIESQVNAYGILSLSKIPNSFDMWSHYANGHRGFILEFKDKFWQHSCMKSKSGDEYPVQAVEYVLDYAINLDRLVNEKKEIPQSTLHKELFFKKTSRWAYEYEHRMVRPLADCPTYKPPEDNYPYTDKNIYLFPFNWDCIASVILGANMSPENKILIAQYCESHNTPLHQAYIIRDIKDWFGKPSTVYIISVDNNENKEIVLRAKHQAFCMDTVSLGNKSTVKISNLTDLPYYKEHRETVEQLYGSLKSDYPADN